MTENIRTTFIKTAIWHGSLDDTARYLAANPELAASDIHTAAITGNVEAVRRFLAKDPANAAAFLSNMVAMPLYTCACPNTYVLRRIEPRIFCWLPPRC